MKRVYFYSLLLLAVLIVGLAVFWHHANSVASVVSTNAVAKTQMPPNSATPALSNNSAVEKTTPFKANTDPNDRLAQMGITPEMTQSQKEEKYAQWYISEAAKLVPKQEAIGLYGKVVDEETQAVAGASIHFIASDASSPKGTTDADTASAGDGSFSLTSGTGSGLSVYVWKTGYYEIKSLNRTDFDPTGGGSSKDNPVLFHLRKKGVGADLITSQHGIAKDFQFSMPRDGTPVWVDFFNRKAGSGGQMELTAIKPPNGQSAPEWSFRLAIPDGGLIENDDEFPFQAPESGYRSTIEFHFKNDDPNWGKPLRKNFYIVFGQPAKCGRITLETAVDMGVILTYAINPDGSRNLEPK